MSVQTFAVKAVRQGEQGQAVVEFAFIMLPFFLLFLLATDAGLFFYGYINGAQAVREGARCGAVGGSDANVKARVKNDFFGAAPTVSVSRTDSDGDGAVGIGDRITVTAMWTYTWISPLATVGLSPTTTKTYTSNMRLETSDTTKPCS